jgi:hypothetical protein
MNTPLQNSVPPSPQRPPQAPATATNGAHKSPVAGATKRQSNPRFPIQLRINITVEMNKSLARIAQKLLLPEGTIGRLGLMQYLQANDPEYRGG